MGELSGKLERLKVWAGPDNEGRYRWRWLEVPEIAPAPKIANREGSIAVFQQHEEPDEALPGDVWIEED